MEKPRLKASEWLFVAIHLRDSFHKLPKSGKFRIGYNATSGNYDRLYALIREQATYSSNSVKELIRKHRSDEKWTRGDYEAKFWLRARWQLAADAALEVAKIGIRNISRIMEPEQLREIVDFLIFDHWNEVRVDHWIAANISDLAYIYSEGMFPREIVRYEDWIKEVESGHYINRAKQIVVGDAPR